MFSVMELKEFAAKYLEVRKTQQKYFNSKDKQILAESKKLEKELDRIAKDIVEPNLFN